MNEVTSKSGRSQSHSYKTAATIISCLMGVFSVVAPILYLLDDYIGKDKFQAIEPSYYETDVDRAYSGENDHFFRLMAISQTGAWRSPGPGQSDRAAGRRWSGNHTIN